MASRSLGRLTLDLIARTGGFEQGMDKAARHSKRRMNEIQREARAMGRVIGATMVAAAGVIAVQVTRTINDMDRLAKSSQAIGVTVEQLSSLEFAASLSGASNEQLATSLQRLARGMNDAAKGIGTAKDAFATLRVETQNTDGSLRDSEEVMKDIADRFAGMEDGAQKTALAMDIFGRSGAALIPLLNQGADGINAMQLEAAQLGLVIDTQTARAAERFNDDLNRMGSLMTGVWRQMTAELLPVLNALATSLLEAQDKTRGFSGTFDGTAERVVGAVAFIVNAVSGFVRVVQIAGRLAAIAFLQMEGAALRFSDTVINRPTRDLNNLIALLSKIPGMNIDFQVPPVSGDVADALRQNQAAIAEGWLDVRTLSETPLWGNAILENFKRGMSELPPAARALGEATADGITEPMGAVPGKVRDAVAEIIAALEQEAATFGMSREEIVTYQLAMEGATWMQIAFAQSLVGSIDKQRQLQELMREGESVYSATRTPAEALNIEILRLNDLLEAGAINWDTYSRAIFDAQDQFDSMRVKSEEAQDEMSQFAVQAARNMQSAFADFLFDPFSSSLRDMASNFALTIHRMVSELLAQQILLSFLGALGGGSGFIGQMAASIGGARADGGPVSPGKAYLVGERGPELFMPNTAGNIQPNGAGGNGVRIINVIDPSMVADYMSGPGGDQVVMNVLKRNAGGARQILA